MWNMKLIAMVSLLLAVILSNIQAWAHPCDYWEPKELPGNYGTEFYPFPSSWSYGDLTFSSPYPDPESLTDAERYIVAGAMNGSTHVAPWHEVVFSAVLAIYSKRGYIPPQLTEEEFMSLWPNSEVEPEVLSYYTSPITNELPRLDAVDFSPGQVYIRTMNEDDIVHFAELVPTYQQNLVDHVWQNPDTNQFEPIEILGEVFYIRLYGERSVIYEEIKYRYRPL